MLKYRYRGWASEEGAWTNTVQFLGCCGDIDVWIYIADKKLRLYIDNSTLTDYSTLNAEQRNDIAQFVNTFYGSEWTWD